MRFYPNGLKYFLGPLNTYTNLFKTLEALFEHFLYIWTLSGQWAHCIGFIESQELFQGLKNSLLGCS